MLVTKSSASSPVVFTNATIAAQGFNDQNVLVLSVCFIQW
jgi:hypothetical protein